MCHTCDKIAESRKENACGRSEKDGRGLCLFGKRWKTVEIKPEGTGKWKAQRLEAA